MYKSLTFFNWYLVSVPACRVSVDILVCLNHGLSLFYSLINYSVPIFFLKEHSSSIIMSLPRIWQVAILNYGNIVLSHTFEMRPVFSSTSYRCHKYLPREHNMWWKKTGVISKLCNGTLLTPFRWNILQMKYLKILECSEAVTLP